MLETNTALIVATCVAFGGAWVIYLNHFRQRRANLGGRRRVMTLPWFFAVDIYLKLSTIAVSIAAIFFDHPALLELHDESWLLLAGSLIAAAGLVLFVIAMRHLGPQYTPCYAAHLPQELVEKGPYRFIRHPVYSANILLLGGLTMAAGSVWLVFNLALMLGCYAFIVEREERSIRAEFQGYEEYAARTGRFFPRLMRRPTASS